MFAVEEIHPSRRRPLRIAVALLSAVALAGVLAFAVRHSPSPKPEVVLPQTTTQVTCGQTITVSIVVGNDLNCPSGSGLIAGHASITINLNGHTFTGNSSSIGVNDPGNSTVTITNGTVLGWLTGARVNGLASKVTGIRASLNTNGVELLGAGSSATGNVVFKNTASGIRALGGTEKVISNVARENTSDGIFVGGSGAVIQTNQAENNTNDGIDDQGTGNTLSGNVTNANGNDGIASLSDPTATVTSNTASYNGAFGIEASPSGKDGGGNAAKGNTQAAQCKDVVCA